MLLHVKWNLLKAVVFNTLEHNYKSFIFSLIIKKSFEIPLVLLSIKMFFIKSYVHIQKYVIQNSAALHNNQILFK